MITVHWNIVVFIVIVIILLIPIVRGYIKNENWDFVTPFLIVVLVAYIFIWGGIFWW